MIDGFHDVSANILKGLYEPTYQEPPEPLPDGHVQDEDRSVAWNREYARDYESRRQAVLEQNRAAHNDASARFEDDMRTAMRSEFGLTSVQAGLIMTRAYVSGHAEGYEKVLAEAKDLCMFYKAMLKAES